MKRRGFLKALAGGVVAAPVLTKKAAEAPIPVPEPAHDEAGDVLKEILLRLAHPPVIHYPPAQAITTDSANWTLGAPYPNTGHLEIVTDFEEERDRVLLESLRGDPAVQELFKQRGRALLGKT